jgi:hypothetical protein
MIPGVPSYTFPGAVGVIEEKLPKAQYGKQQDVERSWNNSGHNAGLDVISRGNDNAPFIFAVDNNFIDTSNPDRWSWQKPNTNSVTLDLNDPNYPLYKQWETVYGLDQLYMPWLVKRLNDPSIPITEKSHGSNWLPGRDYEVKSEISKLSDIYDSRFLEDPAVKNNFDLSVLDNFQDYSDLSNQDQYKYYNYNLPIWAVTLDKNSTPSNREFHYLHQFFESPSPTVYLKGKDIAPTALPQVDIQPQLQNLPPIHKEGPKQLRSTIYTPDGPKVRVADKNQRFIRWEYPSGESIDFDTKPTGDWQVDFPATYQEAINKKTYGGDVSVPNLQSNKKRSLRKAQRGLPDDYEAFLKYSETAPENRRPDADWQYGNPRQYDHYGMWEALGKPKSFEEALAKNPHWQPDEYDGMYHGFSTNPETGVWLKSHIPGESEPGNTAWMENLAFALSNDPNWGPKNQNLVYDSELQRMRYVDRPKEEKYVQPEYVEPEITPEILKAFNNDLGAAIQWYRSWYEGRAELPQFTDVANKRLEALKELPGKANVLQNKEFYASSGKGVTGRFLPYDNKIEVPAVNYQKRIPNTIERNSSYYNGPPYSDVETPFTLSHETLHYLDAAAPQKNTMFDYDTPQFKGAPRTDLSSGVGLLSTNYYDPSFEILPEQHQYPIPPERTATQNITDRTLRTRRKENEKIERAKGFVDYLKQPTEVRARLNVFRMQHKMDPKKKYSTEEILQFMQEDIANPKRNYNIDQLLKIANGDPEVIKKLHDAFVENPTDNQNDIPEAQIMGQFNPSYDWRKSPAENAELNRRAQVAGWNSVDEYEKSGWAYNTAPQQKAKKESAAIADWIDNDYADPKAFEKEHLARYAEAIFKPKEEDKAWVNPETGYAKPYNTSANLSAMNLWDPEVAEGFGFTDKDISNYLDKEYKRSQQVDRVGQIELDLGFSKNLDAKTKKDLLTKLDKEKSKLWKADEIVENTYVKKTLSDFVETQKEERRKHNMYGIAQSTMGPLDALVGLVAAAPVLESALGAELLGTGVTAGNVARPLMWAHGLYNFANPDSDFRQSVLDYNEGTGDWREVAAEGGLNLLNFTSPKSLLGDFKALGNIGKIGSTGTRFKDLQNLQHWAKQYGYKIPDIQRIAQSDKLTDMTFRGIMGRHNTFVRGVSTNWPKVKETLSAKWLGEENAWNKLVKELEAQGINYETNPQAAAEYMASHIPGETGYGRYGLKKGEHALYVSNSKPNAEGYTYGDGYSVTLRRPTDFSSPNRLDWISANEYPISYGFKGSPYGTGIVANDYQKRLPTSIRDFVYVTKDPMKQHRLTQGLDDVYRKAQNDAWKMQQKYRHKKDALAKATDPKKRRGVLAADYDKSRSMSWTPGEDDLVFKDSPNLLDYGKMSYYDFMRAYYNIKPELAPLKVVLKEMFLDPKVYRGFAQNAFGELDPFSHYAFKGKPGEKIFDIVRTDKITPEIWQNTSRAHMGTGSARYTRKQEGGKAKPRDHKSLDNYFEAAWSNSRKTN